MNAIGISKFKVHSLKMLGQMAKTIEIIVTTKRGKLLARITPHGDVDVVDKIFKQVFLKIITKRSN